MSKPNTNISSWNSHLLGKFTLNGLKEWFKQPVAQQSEPTGDLELIANPVEMKLQEIAQALAKQICTPTVTQLKRHYKLTHKQAKFYLAELAKRGVLEHNLKTGRYQLSQGNAQLQVGFNRFVKRFSEEGA